MMHDDDPLAIFLLAEQRSLAEARRVYHQTFGIDCRDKNIDAEIERHFLEAIGDGLGKVALPARLVLALILREGFGRGRGRAKSVKRQLADERAMRRYKQLRAKGVGARKAAEGISLMSKLSPEAILDGRPNRPKRK